MTVILNTTGNPINRTERVKINENWDKIVAGLTDLQLQIAALVEGGEVQDILDTISSMIDEVQALEEDVNDATVRANDATNRANTAAQGVEGWGAATPWNTTTDYLKNNIVTDSGSTWQAKVANKNSKPSVSNASWILLAQKGTDGAGAISSVNGVTPDLSGNVEVPIPNRESITLTNFIPQTTTVDAYPRGVTSFQVFSTDLNSWVNELAENMAGFSRDRIDNLVVETTNFGYNGVQKVYVSRVIGRPPEDIGAQAEVYVRSSYAGIFGKFQNTQQEFKSGYGSPQGIIAASVGTMYINKNGSGEGPSTLYVKEQGDGKTGWVAK